MHSDEPGKLGEFEKTINESAGMVSRLLNGFLFFAQTAFIPAIQFPGRFQRAIEARQLPNAPLYFLASICVAAVVYTVVPVAPTVQGALVGFFNRALVAALGSLDAGTVSGIILAFLGGLFGSAMLPTLIALLSGKYVHVLFTANLYGMGTAIFVASVFYPMAAVASTIEFANHLASLQNLITLFFIAATCFIVVSTWLNLSVLVSAHIEAYLQRFGPPEKQIRAIRYFRATAAYALSHSPIRGLTIATWMANALITVLVTVFVAAMPARVENAKRDAGESRWQAYQDRLSFGMGVDREKPGSFPPLGSQASLFFNDAIRQAPGPAIKVNACVYEANVLKCQARIRARNGVDLRIVGPALARLLYGERDETTGPFKGAKEQSAVPVSLTYEHGNRLSALRAAADDYIAMTFARSDLCSLDISASAPATTVVAIAAQLAIPAVIPDLSNPLDEAGMLIPGTERVAFVYSNPFTIALASDRHFTAFCAAQANEKPPAIPN
ncbi:hypothetical protein [Achromobacter kerstersii]|uniref:hypothetical protein n=1 Tax=Achromobacter kerstersii TaxID=1353890 RepID=UPI00313CBB9F